MPPTGYLLSTGIESCLVYLSTAYPSICDLIVLPNHTHEDRTSRAIKIANGTDENRRGVLFIGGVHARELVNPDMLVSLALKLCQAYTASSGLVFGGKSFLADIVQLIVDTMDIFIFPLVNPDGRTYVQSPTGDGGWRKNRNPNPGSSCKGVDINRNYDFLWPSGIGTGSSPCDYQLYKGTGPFSEPETCNVRHLLDAYPNIKCMIDVHSYGQLLLYPWGDDETQTTTPSMNFQNPVYDGLRGTKGDTIYKEYMPQEDLDCFEEVGTRIKDAIADVRGRVYTLKPGVELYPTSGTSKDYPYSRHYVNASKNKVYSFTLETGTGFQPLYSEALNIIEEVSAGLIEFCTACLCLAEETARATSLAVDLDTLRGFRNRVLRTTKSGRKYIRLLQENTPELMKLVMTDKQLLDEAKNILKQVNQMVSKKLPGEMMVDEKLVQSMEKLFKKVSDKGSSQLKTALKEVKAGLKHFRGKNVVEGLKTADLAIKD